MSVSIRTRMVVLALAWMLPALAAGLWLVDRTAKSELAANERLLRDTARAVSMVVDRELSQRATVARLLAQSGALDQLPLLDDAQRATLAEQARSALGDMAGWVELSVDGRIIFSTHPHSPPSSWPSAVAPPGRITLMEPLRQQPDGTWRAAVVQPVVRGQTIAMLAVTVPAQELQKILDAQRPPADWTAAIIDTAGQVVARHPGGLAYAGRPSTADLRQRIAANSEGLFQSVTLDGAEVVGHFNTSPQGWVYVTAMPRERFGGYLNREAMRVAAGATLLLGLALSGAMLVSRSIVSSIQQLKGNASRMQAGQLVQRRSVGISECDEVVDALAAASEAAERSRAELERQVAAAIERTRVAEQRASQGLRVEALGRLTGGVAHDFNNLLGVVSNSAHLIQRQAAAAPAVAAPSAAILRAVDAGSRLTQHLMRFAGQQPLRAHAVSLQRFLPELQEMLRNVLGKRIDVRIDVASDAPPVRVDASELELALINLALNARDAMPRGGAVTLHARLALEAEAQGLPPGRYAVITLTDQGSGIEPAVAERVFEPFFTTKEVGKGTGLGLSQVHGFCTQAGGRVTLAAAGGGGTAVTLLLPAAGDGVRLAPASGPQAVVEPEALAGLRVLLVEDNPELADATSALLRSSGAQSVHAADARQALELVEREQVDLVLSDIVMPGAIDGIELARRLRLVRPQLPVVLISGYSHRAPPTDEFVMLHKPCSHAELTDALARAALKAMG